MGYLSELLSFTVCLGKLQQRKEVSVMRPRKVGWCKDTMDKLATEILDLCVCTSMCLQESSCMFKIQYGNLSTFLCDVHVGNDFGSFSQHFLLKTITRDDSSPHMISLQTPCCIEHMLIYIRWRKENTPYSHCVMTATTVMPSYPALACLIHISLLSTPKLN